jgi:hypothetical protein
VLFANKSDVLNLRVIALLYRGTTLYDGHKEMDMKKTRVDFILYFCYIYIIRYYKAIVYELNPLVLHKKEGGKESLLSL